MNQSEDLARALIATPSDEWGPIPTVQGMEGLRWVLDARTALGDLLAKVEQVEAVLARNDDEIRSGHGANRAGRSALGEELRDALRGDA